MMTAASLNKRRRFFEKNEKDKETLTLRLNHVEGEVGRLKEKVAKLA